MPHEQISRKSSLRLCAWDYTQPAAYFVTICTQNRSCILSDIRRGGAQLRPLGRICEAQIKALEQRYGVCVQKYVIMPNHIHLLLTIDRAEQSPAPTVSDMVCAFKSLTARQANREENKPHRKIWQRSFYDHVIRNEQDYLETWKYIDENPVKWELDQFYY